MHGFVRSLDRLLPGLDLDFILKSIDFASFDLFFLETPDALFLFLLPQSLDGVGPVLDSCFRLFLEIGSFLVPHLLLVLGHVSDGALLAYPFKFIVRYNSRTLLVTFCCGC